MTERNFRTLTELLDFRAANEPNKVAYRFLADDLRESSSLTYADLVKRALGVACTLTDYGFQNERLVLLYPTGPDFLVGLFGALYSQNIPIPLNPPQGLRSLLRHEAILADSQANAVLTNKETFSKVENFLARFPHLAQSRLVLTDEINLSQFRPTGAIAKSEDIALLQYTSGSTASPKGVMVSHDNFLHNASLISQAAGLTEDSVGLNWLPLFHDMGLMEGVIHPLVANFPVTL
jgi:acyl-CoA synthetase (AMP-forming)/AMP-acid ligase II